MQAIFWSETKPSILEKLVRVSFCPQLTVKSYTLKYMYSILDHVALKHLWQWASKMCRTLFMETSEISMPFEIAALCWAAPKCIGMHAICLGRGPSLLSLIAFRQSIMTCYWYLEAPAGDLEFWMSLTTHSPLFSSPLWKVYFPLIPYSRTVHLLRKWCLVVSSSLLPRLNSLGGNIAFARSVHWQFCTRMM